MAIIIPQYADYRGRVETSRWMNESTEIRSRIEKNILENASLADAGVGIDQNLFPAAALNVKVFEVGATGQIILQGGTYGQVLIQIPDLDGGKVVWRCIGGSAVHTPLLCRPPP
jgi:hypothetical protein